MRKNLYILSLVLILYFVFFPSFANAFSVKLDVNKKNVKVGEEIVLKINTDENISAVSFHIKYDKKYLTFIEGININAAEKDDSIACIYGNIQNEEIKQFEIKFKAIKPIKTSELKIIDAKFRTQNLDESFVESTISDYQDNVEITIVNNYKMIILVRNYKYNFNNSIFNNNKKQKT